MSDKLSHSQVIVLSWLSSNPNRYRHWGGRISGSPDKGALRACMRKGLAKQVGIEAMDLYSITDEGLLALARAMP